MHSARGQLTENSLEPGGDLIWQIGTGYFGCRTEDGRFDPKRFEERAALEQVRMIEVKLSQGAKPVQIEENAFGARDVQLSDPGYFDGSLSVQVA